MRAFGIIGNCRGKNRLVPQLVETLMARGVGVSTLKRVGDEIDLDRPGKESYAHRQAGAREVMIANAFRYAIMSEYTQPTEPAQSNLSNNPNNNFNNLDNSVSNRNSVNNRNNVSNLNNSVNNRNDGASNLNSLNNSNTRNNPQQPF